MTSLKFTLPKSMRAFVEEQMAAEGYRNVSRFLQSLIRERQRRKAKEDLEAMLLEGARSPLQIMGDDDLDEMEERLWKEINEEPANERLASQAQSRRVRRQRNRQVPTS